MVFCFNRSSTTAIILSDTETLEWKFFKTPVMTSCENAVYLNMEVFTVYTYKAVTVRQ